jgi:hypothetical protein
VRGLPDRHLREKNVFGARRWVLDGNMAYGVTGERLLVRLGAGSQDGADAALDGFDPVGKGKPMPGWFSRTRLRKERIRV